MKALVIVGIHELGKMWEPSAGPEKTHKDLAARLMRLPGVSRKVAEAAAEEAMLRAFAAFSEVYPSH